MHVGHYKCTLPITGINNFKWVLNQFFPCYHNSRPILFQQCSNSAAEASFYAVINKHLDLDKYF